jgi:hypothetical protein
VRHHDETLAAWEQRMASAIAVVRLQAGYFAKQAFAAGARGVLADR